MSPSAGHNLVVTASGALAGAAVRTCMAPGSLPQRPQGGPGLWSVLQVSEERA